MEEKKKVLNRFTPFYTLWFGLFLILVDMNMDLYMGLWLTLLTLCLMALLFAIGIFAWPTALARHIWYRRWRRVTSLIAAPVLALGIFTILMRVGLDASWVRLQFNKPFYLAEIARLPNEAGRSKSMGWHWGSTGFAGIANSETEIIYDESDQVMWLRTNCNNTEMRNEASCSDWEAPQVSVRHLEGHFYLVTAYFY